MRTLFNFLLGHKNPLAPFAVAEKHTPRHTQNQSRRRPCLLARAPALFRMRTVKISARAPWRSRTLRVAPSPFSWTPAT